MDDFAKKREAADLEWLAWQDVVKEWNAAGLLSMNDSSWDPLVRALRVWGERLVALRLLDSSEARHNILASTLYEYEEVRS